MTEENSPEFHKIVEETGLAQLSFVVVPSYTLASAPPNHNPRKNILEILPNEFHPEGANL